MEPARRDAHSPMVQVSLSHETETILPAPHKTVFDLLYAPDRWGVLQPHVSGVIKETTGVYSWEFHATTIIGLKIQPRYRTRLDHVGYEEIRWSPEGDGAFRGEGTWHLQPVEDMTRVRLNVALRTDVDLPAPVVRVVHPVLQAQFAEQIDRLLVNLGRHLRIS